MERERKRRETLFTVHDRTVITRACIHDGGWSGTRRGRRVYFTHDRTREPGHQVTWSVSIAPRKARGGDAGTVFEAMEYVECEAQRAPLTLREARLIAAEFKEDENGIQKGS